MDWVGFELDNQYKKQSELLFFSTTHVFISKTKWTTFFLYYTCIYIYNIYHIVYLFDNQIICCEVSFEHVKTFQLPLKIFSNLFNLELFLFSQTALLNALALPKIILLLKQLLIIINVTAHTFYLSFCFFPFVFFLFVHTELNIFCFFSFFLIFGKSLLASEVLNYLPYTNKPTKKCFRLFRRRIMEKNF